MMLVARSGVSWGPGVIMLALGLVLVVVAIDAIRPRGPARPWWVAFGAAVAAIGVVTLCVFRMYVFADFLLYGPGVGVYLVALGGLVSASASPSLRGRAAPVT